MNIQVDKYLIINHRGNVTLREREPSLKGNEIALRLRLEIPGKIFERPILTAKMTLPDGAVPSAVITPTIVSDIERIVKEATDLNIHVSVIEHEEEKKD